MQLRQMDHAALGYSFVFPYPKMQLICDWEVIKDNTIISEQVSNLQ